MIWHAGLPYPNFLLGYLPRFSKGMGWHCYLRLKTNTEQTMLAQMAGRLIGTFQAD